MSGPSKLCKMLAYLLWLLFTWQGADGASTSPSFHEWFQARCGPKGSSTWLYQGGLYDPLTGEQLAHVEGLELVQSVTEPTSIKGNRDDLAETEMRGKPKTSTKIDDLSAARENDDNVLDLLSIRESLKHPKAKFDQCATILSQKIFIYRNKDDKKTLLQTIKLRPYSPERKIPLNQAVSVYATANTFIERSPGEWIIHGEWPDGRTVWNRARVVRQDDAWTPTEQPVTQARKRRAQPTTISAAPSLSKSLEYTVHVRPRSGRSTQRCPDLTLEPERPSSTETTGNVTVTTKSPPRSALFSFGPSTSKKLSTGARETYQYEWNHKMVVADDATKQPRGLFGNRKKKTSAEPGSEDADCSVRYTRYGEGPVWYGPNRFCTLELRGRRWPSNTPLPDHIQAWCLRHGWEHDDSRSNVDRVRAFRENDLDVLEILGISSGNSTTVVETSGLDADHARDRKVRWMKKAKAWGTKLRQATTLELSPGSND